MQVQAPDQRGAGWGAGRARPGRRLGCGGWRGGRDGIDGCTAEPSGRAGRPTDRGWQVQLPRPVPVNGTTLTSTRLGARVSWLLPAMSLGMSGLGGRGRGDHLGPLPLPLREKWEGWGGPPAGDGGAIRLHPWPRGERESRIRGMGYISQIKEGNRGEKLGSGKKACVSDPRGYLPSVGLGSWMRCLQLPNLPSGAAETLSLQQARVSNPLVRRECEGEGPGTTFMAWKVLETEREC